MTFDPERQLARQREADAIIDRMSPARRREATVLKIPCPDCGDLATRVYELGDLGAAMPSRSIFRAGMAMIEEAMPFPGTVPPPMAKGTILVDDLEAGTIVLSCHKGHDFHLDVGRLQRDLAGARLKAGRSSP